MMSISKWQSRLRCIVYICGMVLCGCAILPTDSAKKITVVSYNVRGTFGDVAKQQKKAEQIALDLQAHEIERSDIILFQEIDNQTIVLDLVSEHLALSGFRYFATAPKDASSITQAIISRHPITTARVHTIDYASVPKTRAFLEAAVQIGERSLTLYNLHLKSKRGGSLETEPQRAAVLRALRHRIASQLRANPRMEIVIAGDMNSEIAEVAEVAAKNSPVALVPYGNTLSENDGLHIAQLSDLPIKQAQTEDPSTVFISPWQDANWHGTYQYRQQWERIDHFFLSLTLFNGAAFEYDQFSVAYDEQESALSNGASHTESASDHLPIALTLTLE